MNAFGVEFLWLEDHFLGPLNDCLTSQISDSVKPPYNEPLYYEHLEHYFASRFSYNTFTLLLYNESSIKRMIFNKRIQYKYMEIILFITNGVFFIYISNIHLRIID